MKAGGMDVADLDDYNLLMDISSSPGRNQAEQKELLSKEEARRKNAASFNQQVRGINAKGPVHSASGTSRPKGVVMKSSRTHRIPF